MFAATFALAVFAVPSGIAAPKSPRPSAKIDCDAAFANSRILDTHPPIPAQCLSQSGDAPAPSPTIGLRQIEPPPEQTSACSKLAADYEGASKQLAMNFAEGAGDNSAVRATMRETRNATVMEKARLTVELMRGNNCKMPTEAPSMERYLSPALECQTALLTAQGNAMPAACVMANWQPRN